MDLDESHWDVSESVTETVDNSAAVLCLQPWELLAWDCAFLALLLARLLADEHAIDLNTSLSDSAVAQQMQQPLWI